MSITAQMTKITEQKCILITDFKTTKIHFFSEIVRTKQQVTPINPQTKKEPE